MHKLIEDQVGNEQYPPDGKDISAVQWLKSKVRVDSINPPPLVSPSPQSFSTSIHSHLSHLSHLHQGASERMVAAAEACYANDNAASLAQLGLTEMIEENRWGDMLEWIHA